MQLFCTKCGHGQRVSVSDRLIRPFPVTCRSCATVYPVNWKIRVPNGSRIICSWCAKKQEDSPRCAYCDHTFYGYSPADLAQSASRPAKAKTGGAAVARIRSIPQRARIITICLMLLSLAAALIGTSVSRKQTEQQYLSDYVLAIYGIKSGMDRCSRACGDIVTDGKNRGDLANDRPAGMEEKANMAIVKDEVDQAVRKLEEPPEKFAALSAPLKSLHGNYLRLDTLANAPFGPLANIESEVNEANAYFTGEIARLKSAMPPELTKEFKESGKKYDLGFINN